jgi:predicted P-loop ATPase
MTLTPTNGLLPPPPPHGHTDDPTVRFFKLILPSRGHYVAAIKLKNSKGFRSSIFATTVEELWAVLEEADRDGFEVYFACASFKQPLNNSPGTPRAERRLGRTHANICGAKAFWLDIDVGTDKPYKTRDEALATLAAFCKKLNLPRPIVVGSGGDKSGLHVYWPLQEDITEHALWLHYASGLKQLCFENHLHADRTRTSDLSSVLRPPGTHNRKHGPDVLVEINVSALEIEPYPLAQFEIFAKHSLTGDPRQQQQTNSKRQKQATLRLVPKQTSPRLLTGARAYSGDVPPAYVSEILKYCGQMQRLRDEKGKTENPHWWACLGVCAFCKDGDDFAHKLSEGDTARYTWEETQELLERWRNSTNGATTCQHFHDEVDPSICEQCKHWKKINSPYALGITPRVEEEADEEKDEEEADKGDADNETAWDYITRLPAKVRSSLRFEYTQKGTSYKSQSYINAEAMLTVLGIKGSHDVFHDRKLVTAPDGVTAELGPQLCDAIIRAIRRKSARVFRVDFGIENIRQALEAACEANQFDPICDYLASLRWDGRPRLDRWLTTYCGAEDTPLNRAIGRKTLIAAVRRPRRPGCKFDHMLILEGVQRAGKSSVCYTLAGGADNFSDLPILHENSQKQQEQLAGRWFYEIAELVGMPRAEVETLKGFLSRMNDRGRNAYGRFVKDQLRRGIFIGTTNDAEYLRDPSGGSRFWPVKVAVVSAIDLDALTRDRDQIFAEAAHYEAKGESLIIPQELWPAAAAAQEARLMKDPWEDKLSGVQGEIVKGDGESWIERISTTNVLECYLHLLTIHMTDLNAKRAAVAMRKLGWQGPKVMKFKERTLPMLDNLEGTRTVTKRGFWRPASEPPNAQAPKHR